MKRYLLTVVMELAVLAMGYATLLRDQQTFELKQAAKQNDTTEAIKALIEAGADVSAKDGWTGDTALMWTSMYGHMETVRALIDAGAHINLKDTALIFAVTEGHTDIVKLLKAAGATE